jgi:predicted aspartyl protease
LLRTDEKEKKNEIKHFEFHFTGKKKERERLIEVTKPIIVFGSVKWWKIKSLVQHFLTNQTELWRILKKKMRL